MQTGTILHCKTHFNLAQPGLLKNMKLQQCNPQHKLVDLLSIKKQGTQRKKSTSKEYPGIRHDHALARAGVRETCEPG